MKCTGQGKIELFVGREPDSMNRTTLLINGQKVWPAGILELELEKGDKFTLGIPSGILDGEITALPSEYDDVKRFRFTGAWEGQIAGMSEGRSGCAEFSLYPEGAVESSIGDGMEWEDLKMVHSLYDYFPQPEYNPNDAPRKKQEKMRKIWDFLSQAEFWA